MLAGAVAMLPALAGEHEEGLEAPSPADRGGAPPHLVVTKNVTPGRVWPAGSPLQPREARIDLRLSAAGSPAVKFDPQDVVFAMDNSGSMSQNDPTYLRVAGAKRYVDNLLMPDRGAAVSFADVAVLVNDHHLTHNYTQVKKDLEVITSGSGTNIEAALNLSVGELASRGFVGRTRAVIFITDGYPDPPQNNVTRVTVETARRNLVQIHSIGLSPDHDSSLLRWLARETNGSYHFAQTASDLVPIYESISKRETTNVTASSAVVRDVLPAWVGVVPGSVSNASVNVSVGASNTTLEVALASTMMLGDSWSVSYNVTVRGAGNTTLTLTPDARVSFSDWNDTAAVEPMPQAWVYVIVAAPPPPPPPPPPAVPPPSPPPLEFFPTPAPPVAAGALPQAAGAVSQGAGAIFAPLVGIGIAEFLKAKAMRVRVRVRTAKIPARPRGRSWG